MLVVLCLVVQQHLWGKIRNGYEADIDGAHRLLQNLTAILEDGRSEKKLSVYQKEQLTTKITWLKEYIAYYELTERLLEQFRLIAPDLYYAVDTVKDGKGRPTDVCVKFMPEEEMRISVAGTTNITQGEDDPHAYHSEYGPHTVSIRVVIGKQSLWLLAHELGHVKYQVPHLADYMEYYDKHYKDRKLKANYIGHNSKDPSGNLARAYQEEFREHYRLYTKNTQTMLTPAVVLLQEIRDSF
jgi:hypothetical protein